MATNEYRSKLGYVTFQDLLERIKEKKLDAFDINFDPKSHQLFIISPDLEPIQIISQISTYDTKIEADNDLNSRNDTYEGQIICIKRNEDNSYIAHVVCRGNNNKYYSSPISLNDSELILPSIKNEGSSQLEWEKIFIENNNNCVELYDGAFTFTIIKKETGRTNLKIYPSVTLSDDGSGNVTLLL